MTRLEFTAETKRQAYTRSRGVCECHRIPVLRRPQGCGVILGTGNCFYEHIEPDAIKQDNSLENAACLCRTCWREKTAKYDRKIIAKSNHQRDRARGISRTLKGRPMVGTKASGIKLHMGGAPTWRDSGRPMWKGR